MTAPLPADQQGDGALDDPALNVLPTGATKNGKPFNPADVGPSPTPSSAGIWCAISASRPAKPITASTSPPTPPGIGTGAPTPSRRSPRSDPKLRLFRTAGLYDLTTPSYAARYTLDQAAQAYSLDEDPLAKFARLVYADIIHAAGCVSVDLQPFPHHAIGTDLAPRPRSLPRRLACRIASIR